MRYSLPSCVDPINEHDRRIGRSIDMVKMPTTMRPVGNTDRATRYAMWKEEHVPLLYDWISSRRMAWPHAALRWGARQPITNGRAANSRFSTRALYLGERTGTQSRDPDTLLHFDVRVVDENVNSPREVAQPWHADAQSNGRVDRMSSPEFWLRKRVIHPGEVNKIRVVSPGVVITHTDRAELFMWDMNRQPNRRHDEAKTNYSTPDITMVGHTKKAEFALSVSCLKGPYEPSRDIIVASGGSDTRVVVWKFEDYQSVGRTISSSLILGGEPNVGHVNNVEDVSFNRTDRNALASVGRDRYLILWDLRSPSGPSSLVRHAHDEDINSCDYGGVDENLIVSGGSDKAVKVWDRRKLMGPNGAPTPSHVFNGHVGQVNSVMWNRHVPAVCASGGDDGHVMIWDCARDSGAPLHDPRSSHNGLLFTHAGHTDTDAKVMDLEWIPDELDPWCIATLSEIDAGGSTVQVWRMSDYIHRPKEQVNSEMVRYSAWASGS